jgi:hypothetical protein
MAKLLLEKLEPTLSVPEKEYVEKWGPKISDLYAFHADSSRYGGCPEGKSARRSAEQLEKSEKERLDKAEVSPERQKLLEDLVMMANTNTIPSPIYESDTLHFLKSRYQNSKASIWLELARILKIDYCTIILLDHQWRIGKMLSEAEKETLEKEKETSKQ